MKYQEIRTYLNIAIGAVVAVSWLILTFHAQHGAFMARRLYALKYFTTLSNLLEGAVSIFYAAVHTGKKERSRKILHLAEQAKYIAACAVGVTFFTVMLFLGPLMGYGILFTGTNLFLHLIIPVTALLEALFLADGTMEKKDNAFAVCPVLLYGIYYLGNIFINGKGHGMQTNDWYGFLHWGFPAGFLIFGILLFFTYGMGAVLRIGNRAFRNRQA